MIKDKNFAANMIKGYVGQSGEGRRGHLPQYNRSLGKQDRRTRPKGGMGK